MGPTQYESFRSVSFWEAANGERLLAHNEFHFITPNIGYVQRRNAFGSRFQLNCVYAPHSFLEWKLACNKYC